MVDEKMMVCSNRRYVRSRPILLYSNLVDRPDVSRDVVRGIPDESVLQEVRVVILRPSGDRHSVLIPSRQNIDGFGEWWATELNLGMTDEFGTWTIRWIYKTSTGDIEENYTIDIVNVNNVPVWCFQPNPIMDDTLPDDVKEMLVSDV